MSKYNKALVAIGGFLGVVSAALSDGSVSVSEGTGILIALVAAYGVYRAPNKQS